MKKILVVLLAVVLLLSMAACTQTPEPEKQPDTPTTDPTLTLQDELNKVPEATHYDWADNLPRMDGSTSTIPLEAGIRAALFGISQAEAELQVQHSTTYGSFDNLINGRTDLIFSVPLSEEQIKQATEKGVELEMTAIAAEGFVFVVNAKNPVDTLTQQQIKDIYSGKITNWKEVGGNDAPIVAYQRNETSGSQNFMHTFMGDTPLMDKLTDFVPTSMGGLMDAVAYYDNAENAIGYSVYAYAADMYGNGNEIKFIHVDGVEPTKPTMADGSYPLLGYNYAVYDKATPADSNLRKLVEWLGTDEGQRAVKAAGYIPLRPVGEMSETVIALYTATGTGPEKPADYTPSLVWNRLSSTLVQRDKRTYEDLGIDGLTNEELEKEINDFLLETKEELLKAPNVSRVEMRDECINGYCAVSVISRTEEYQYVDVRTRIYDLVTGKQIPYSDLFFKGENYVQEINTALSREFHSKDKELILKREFVGLEAGHDDFFLTRVQFSPQSLYTADYTAVTIPRLYTKSVLSVPRDLTGVFDENVQSEWRLVTDQAYATNHRLLLNSLQAQLLDERYYDPAVCKVINDQLREIYPKEFNEDYFSTYYGDTFTGAEGCQMNLQIIGDRWVAACGGLFFPFVKNNQVPAEYNAFYLFDLTTGEQVPYTALLKEGWEKEAVWYLADEEVYLGIDIFNCESDADGVVTVQEPDTTDWRFANFYVGDSVVKVVFEQNNPSLQCLWAEIPLDCLG